jgi:hypothetical protein
MGNSIPRIGFPLRATLASLTLATGLLQTGMAQDLEVVDNSPFEITENGVTAALLTVRPLTAAGFGKSDTTQELQRFRLTKDLIANAAAQFDEVRTELARRSLNVQEVPLQTGRR